MKTKRLTLRPLQLADARRIAALAGDWDVARFTGRIAHPYSEFEAQRWVNDLADGEVVFGIETAADGLIGICGYTPDGDGNAELGYWIGKPFWGRGYATEAAKTVMTHGFGIGGIRAFTCSHFDDNERSARVIAKLGFRRVGPCVCWSEARKVDMPAVCYERKRPWIAAMKAMAS